jgi:uncharacterized protein YceH (UPF0502 family)
VARCSAITASGEPCRGVPVHGSPYCPAHHPDTQAARRAGASRGGRATTVGAKELTELKGELAALYANVLTGEVDKGVAAVAAQVANVRLRALELERRHRETDELEAQVAELERRIFGVAS